MSLRFVVEKLLVYLFTEKLIEIHWLRRLANSQGYLATFRSILPTVQTAPSFSPITLKVYTIARAIDKSQKRPTKNRKQNQLRFS